MLGVFSRFILKLDLLYYSLSLIFQFQLAHQLYHIGTLTCFGFFDVRSFPAFLQDYDTFLLNTPYVLKRPTQVKT